ncbi:hypothetical protein F2P81_006546 [Scophthalmus maximus]|uniref:Uncharacterized protein n=1 Tax=Scophthalmus maximus TaxID=52904 RepID=A0A6A4T8F9_SCOMX|nr:hypothetical protein F2P81_006546 [Scophthalmus maximus]
MHVCVPAGDLFSRGLTTVSRDVAVGPESRSSLQAAGARLTGHFRLMSNVEKSGQDSDLHCAAIFTFTLSTNGTRQGRFA